MVRGSWPQLLTLLHLLGRLRGCPFVGEAWTEATLPTGDRIDRVWSMLMLKLVV